MGELIHGRFGGIEPGYSAGATHIGSASDVSFSTAKGHTQIRHAVLEGRSLAAVFMMSIKDRPRVNVVMVQRDQLSFFSRSQTNALLSARPMSNGVKHHFASEHQSHRPAHLSRGGCCQRTQCPGPQLAAET